MPIQTDADVLGRLSGALDALRRDIPEMPASWGMVTLSVAKRPGCTVAWLAENVGLTASVVNRVLQELGPEPVRGHEARGLIGSVADPINGKRKIYMLTNKGRDRIEEVLLAACGQELPYRGVTVEAYNTALTASNEIARVRTDHFGQSQLTTIKAAANKRFPDFVGDNLVAFPLEPAEPLIGPQQGADGESYDGLSGWVTSHRGRWFEMPTIYPVDGGVALADFDDPNDAFHFVLRWRGGHDR